MVKNLSYENVDYLELRLDVIEDITSSKATDIIKSIKQITQTPIILTNRTKKEGGLFDKSEEERITILLENAHLVEITDIELSTDEELRQKVIDKANKTIISYHNFEKTPDKEFLQEKECLYIEKNEEESLLFLSDSIIIIAQMWKDEVTHK